MTSNTITQKEFDKIYKNYIRKKEKDNGKLLDLRGNVIKFCKLENIDLSSCNLSHCFIMCCELRNVNLNSCDLSCTKFVSCRLTDCNMNDANLFRTHWNLCLISSCDFGCAKLMISKWESSLVMYNNFVKSDWTSSLVDSNQFVSNYFDGVNLSNVKIRNCNLTREYGLKNAINLPYIPMACPDEGAFIGWKCIVSKKKLVKLEIPADAKRLSSIQSGRRKCRCDKAKVLGIYEYDGTKSNLTSIPSDYNPNFIYTVDETVRVDDFDDNIYKECSNGIHFFMNRREAIEYARLVK